jgi:hypothetical protein
LSDPNVDIKKKVENVVNVVIGEDHGGVTINKNGTVTIPWPTRQIFPFPLTESTVLGLLM